MKKSLYNYLHGMEGFFLFFSLILLLSSLHFPELDIRKFKVVSGLFAGFLKFSGRDVDEGETEGEDWWQ